MTTLVALCFQGKLSMTILSKPEVQIVLYVAAFIGLVTSGFSLSLALFYGYQYILDIAAPGSNEYLNGVVYGLLFNLSSTVCVLPISLLLGSAGKASAKKYVGRTAVILCAASIGLYLYVMSL